MIQCRFYDLHAVLGNPVFDAGKLRFGRAKHGRKGLVNLSGYQSLISRAGYLLRSRNDTMLQSISAAEAEMQSFGRRHVAAASRPLLALMWLLALLFGHAVRRPPSADAARRPATSRWPATPCICAIVMQFDREPDPKWFLLRGPHRLVIDLPETSFVVEPKDAEGRAA